MMRQTVRFLVWSLGLCDSNGDPSAPKITAFCIINVVLYLALRNLRFDAWSSLILSLAMAAIFGRSAFLHFLNRNTWSRAETANETITTDLAAMLKALPDPYRDNESGDPK